MDEFVKQTHRLKNDILEARAANSGEVLTTAVMKLRNQVKKQSANNQWPPNTE